MNFSDLTTPQANDPARRAAIVAHSLSVEDQGWLFSQMAPSELPQLKSLLAELVQLGVPADRRLLEQALDSTETSGVLLSPSTAKNSTAAGASDLDFFSSLNVVREMALVTVLNQEPALLVARFLHIRAWSWEQKVFDGLSASLRQQVADLLVQPSAGLASGRALQDALLRAMRLRCERWIVAAPGQLPPERSRFSQAKFNVWLQRWSSRRSGLRS